MQSMCRAPRTMSPRAPGRGAWLRRAVGAAALGLLASACGQYSGSGSGEPATAGSTSDDGASAAPGFSAAEGAAAFETTVYPLLVEHCADCHAGTGPGTPAISHTDPMTAYNATMDNQKVNLGTPENSRLVRRLGSDFHNCWTDCVSDAQAMLDQIVAWIDLLDFEQGGITVEDGLTSGNLTLADGVEDEGQERYATNLIALYEFKEGSGGVARDTSGVEPAANLAIGEGTTWLSSYGLNVEEGRAIASGVGSAKLYDRIASREHGTHQYTVEAWITPSNITQEGPARIVTYSGNTSSRNFTLGQVLYNYDFRNRSINQEVDHNGTPGLQTYDADQDAQPRLQHVVITYDLYRGRRIHVDGRFTDDIDEVAPGRLWNWDAGFVLVLGDENTSNRNWEGRIHLVAIYNQALTAAQIEQNYEAGVGKRLLMTFDLAPWTGAGTAIQFVVSELDDYSYLFCAPTFVGGGAGVAVRNIRIAVNGQVPVSGQAFRTLDALVTDDKEELSAQCSVIPKGDLGPDGDVFSVVFEYLGNYEDPVMETVGTPPADVFPDPLPIDGVRDFDQILRTMGAVTGVPLDTPAVRDTFAEVEQQLPPSYDARAFVSSHQVGIAKLALEFCDALVDDPARRTAFFGPSFQFDSPPEVAFAAQADRDAVARALVAGMLGADLQTQPTEAEVLPVLDGLIDDLTAGCAPGLCDAERTRTVVKGACAAVLGSAGMVVH